MAIRQGSRRRRYGRDDLTPRDVAEARPLLFPTPTRAPRRRWPRLGTEDAPATLEDGRSVESPEVTPLGAARYFCFLPFDSSFLLWSPDLPGAVFVDVSGWALSGVDGIDGVDGVGAWDLAFAGDVAVASVAAVA